MPATHTAGVRCVRHLIGRSASPGRSCKSNRAPELSTSGGLSRTRESLQPSALPVDFRCSTNSFDRLLKCAALRWPSYVSTSEIEIFFNQLLPVRWLHNLARHGPPTQQWSSARDRGLATIMTFGITALRAYLSRGLGIAACATICHTPSIRFITIR